jgi:hypothetical protein
VSDLLFMAVVLVMLWVVGVPTVFFTLYLCDSSLGRKASAAEMAELITRPKR